MSRFAWLLSIALLCGHVGTARAEAAPPAVDLAKLSVSAHGVTAPTLDGGQAALTLDPLLQRAAERLLREASAQAGAVVAIEVRSGRIWAFAESGGRDVLTRPRAPAASVFKLVTSAALLERTRVTPDLRVCISGGEHGIWRRHLEPARDDKAQCAPFSDALGHSRNAVYAQLATRFLLRDDLVETADRFGFNQPLPFDVAASLGTLSVPYNDLDFARTATGFENSTLSPLGAAYLSHVIATGGRALRLHIVESAGEYEIPDQAEEIRRVLRASTARRLTRMMEVTVHSGTSLQTFTAPNGRSFLGSVRVAGKTGTLKPTPTSPTASWFTGFAPSRSPEIVVGVLLLNGDVWRRKANELARDLLRVYFAARGVRGVSDPFTPPDTAR
jgi:cell division protein FtsI/penicillin-binding protein 2